MFRWGVLSTAAIGREQVIPAICDAENGVLSAVASRDRDSARSLADRFGAPHAFGSYDDLLQSDAIDGVYIPLPTSMHVEWSERAARAGKHVLCEKPVALHASEIERLIAARDETGVLISEAFMVVYHPQWLKVRDLIKAGAIGTLRHVQGAFSYRLDDPENMRNRPDLGGGGLPDIGVYPTVTARFATGQEPERLSATVTRHARFGTDSYATCLAAFDGFDLSFYVSTQMAQRQFMVFHGSDGLIEVPSPFNAGKYDYPRVVLWNTAREHAEVFNYPYVHQYRLMIEAFAEAAQSGDRSGVFSLEDSVRNQRVIDAIYRAGEDGGWVDV